MKNFRFLYYLLFAAVVPFLSSCGDDDDPVPAPTMAVSGATGSTSTDEGYYNPGTNVTVNYQATSGANIDRILVKRTQGTTTSTLDTKSSGFDSNTSHNGSFTYNIPATETGTVILTFEIVDKEGTSTTDSYTLFIGDAINTYTAVLLGGQDNPNTGSFYDAEGNVVYLQSDAKTNAAAVDFVYFYGASNLATIAAPSDEDAGVIFNNAISGVQTWSVRNATTFGSTNITAAEFDAMTNDARIVAATSNLTETKANTLSTGEVFAFQTVDGNKGLVKVTDVTGTQSGSITFTVKMQQ